MTEAKIQRNPQLMNRLVKLRQVPVGRIQDFNIEIVGVTIKELSTKDCQRAIYILSSVLNDVRNMTNSLTKAFEKIQVGVKNMIEELEKEPNKTIKQKDILTKLIEIIAVPELKPEIPADVNPSDEKLKIQKSV